MGGRGSGSGLKQSDGPRGGGGGDTKWNQPNTPQMRPPAPNIRGVIGAKGKPISATHAVKSINPFRDAEYGDYSENCQRCVVAFELNRRGYKVEAEATWENDTYPRGNHWLSAFKGGKLEDVGARNTAAISKNVLSKMGSWGEGSRAIVKVQYPGGNSGHVFNVEYHRGKLYYYDAQTGVSYKNRTVFDHVVKGNVQIVRSDNLDIADNVRDMVRKRR